MSYYRRYYHRNSYYRRPLYIPTPKKENSFDIYEYLRLEFFNADEETFKQIARYYRINYGDSAYSYMLKTYRYWKVGSVSISSLTMGRILECVPKFLSSDKRMFILKCEIHNFLEKVKEKNRYKFSKLSNLHSIFETIQNELINFNQSNLHWFIGKNIFPDEQINCYLNVCKYALNERLLQSYRQVLNDLKIIEGKFLLYKSYQVDNAHYKIDFLNLGIDILNIVEIDVTHKKLDSFPLNYDHSFSRFGDGYILEELMKMDFYEKEGKVNSLLKSNDFDTIFSNFITLTKTSNQIIMNSTLQGEGGILSIRLEFIPINKSIELVLISSLKIFGVIFGLLAIAFLILKLELYWIFLFIFFSGYFVIETISDQTFTIKKALTQIKRYGKY